MLNRNQKTRLIATFISSVGMVQACGANADRFLSPDDIAAGFADLENNPLRVLEASAALPLTRSMPSADDIFKGLKPLSFGNERAPAGASAGVDLRAFDTPVKDQGQEGLCTAFAATSVLEHMSRRVRGISLDLSERHHWNNYKVYATVESAKAAVANWLTFESYWPYKSNIPQSSHEADLIARADSYEVLDDVNKVYTLLDAKQPLMLGFDTTTELQNVGVNGLIPAEGPESGLGHAVAVVGYQNRADIAGGGYFILKNSWSERSGDKGYFYMPYKYCELHRCGFVALHGIDLGKVASIIPPDPVSTTLDLRISSVTTKRSPADSGNRRWTSIFTRLEGADISKVAEVVWQYDPALGEQAVSSASTGFRDNICTYGQTNWAYLRGALVRLKDGRTVSLGGKKVGAEDASFLSSLLRVSNSATPRDTNNFTSLSTRVEGAGANLVQSVAYNYSVQFGGKSQFVQTDANNAFADSVDTFGQSGWKYLKSVEVTLNDGCTHSLATPVVP